MCLRLKYSILIYMNPNVGADLAHLAAACSSRTRWQPLQRGIVTRWRHPVGPTHGHASRHSGGLAAAAAVGCRSPLHYQRLHCYHHYSPPYVSAVHKYVASACISASAATPTIMCDHCCFIPWDSSSSSCGWKDTQPCSAVQQANASARVR